MSRPTRRSLYRDRVKVTIYLDRDEYDRLHAMAVTGRTPATQIIRHALLALMNRSTR